MPNFRPEWRYYSWQTSLLGACLTVVAMFFLNWQFALVTILIVILLFVLIYSTFDASLWVGYTRGSHTMHACMHSHSVMPFTHTHSLSSD